MWKLFYSGHQPGAEPLDLNGSLKVSTFSSERGSWQEAPPWGVMGVAHVDDVVGYSRDSGDFYVMSPWAGDQPWACDSWGLMDHLIEIGVLHPAMALTELTANQLIEAGVKFGRSIRNNEWRRILSWMDQDPELPRKSARYPRERP